MRPHTQLELLLVLLAALFAGLCSSQESASAAPDPVLQWLWDVDSLTEEQAELITGVWERDQWGGSILDGWRIDEGVANFTQENYAAEAADLFEDLLDYARLGTKVANPYQAMVILHVDTVTGTLFGYRLSFQPHIPPNPNSEYNQYTRMLGVAKPMLTSAGLANGIINVKYVTDSNEQLEGWIFPYVDGGWYWYTNVLAGHEAYQGSNKHPRVWGHHAGCWEYAKSKRTIADFLPEIQAQLPLRAAKFADGTVVEPPEQHPPEEL